MPHGITSAVVDFLINQDSAPTAVKKKAVEHIIDGTAVILAGSRDINSFFDVSHFYYRLWKQLKTHND